WKTFLRNHADAIASMDMFVVPTVSFRLLYGLLILQHTRRELLWLGVTTHPNAQWIAQQLTEALGWKEVPRYLIARSRRRRWRGLHPACLGDGYSRPPHRGALALAKRVCGTPHWLDPTGLPRPRRGARRTAPAPSASFLSDLLQRGPHASVS